MCIYNKTHRELAQLHNPNLVEEKSQTFSCSGGVSVLKFKLLHFLPKAVSSEAEEEIAGTTIVLRGASMRSKTSGMFGFKEPRSPKVSCIGKVSNTGKKKLQEKNKDWKTDHKRIDQSTSTAIPPPKSSFILKLFWVSEKKGIKSANPYLESSSTSAATASSIKSVPELGQAKRFAHSHRRLPCFNWRIHVSSTVVPDRLSSLPNKREKRKDVVVVENIELAPRKEINLWKKRMVAPPPPLLL